MLYCEEHVKSENKRLEERKRATDKVLPNNVRKIGELVLSRASCIHAYSTNVNYAYHTYASFRTVVVKRASTPFSSSSSSSSNTTAVWRMVPF
jgi:hypothetical protein